MHRFVATVLTVYGIETAPDASFEHVTDLKQVATVLTVYGIETNKHTIFFWLNVFRCNSTYRLRY